MDNCPVRPGDRHGKLTVLSVTPGWRGNGFLVRVLCDCGVERSEQLSWLRQGSRSCGCSAGRLLHGMARVKRREPIYSAWRHMWTRCTNPRYPRFDRYGGRGITICDRWRSFELFAQDMGPRPSPRHSLDRIDNDGNYEPGNCRWATSTEQMRNRSTSIPTAVRDAVIEMMTAGTKQKTIGKMLGIPLHKVKGILKRARAGGMAPYRYRRSETT